MLRILITSSALALAAGAASAVTVDSFDDAQARVTDDVVDTTLPLMTALTAGGSIVGGVTSSTTISSGLAGTVTRTIGALITDDPMGIGSNSAEVLNMPSLGGVYELTSFFGVGGGVLSYSFDVGQDFSANKLLLEGIIASSAYNGLIWVSDGSSGAHSNFTVAAGMSDKAISLQAFGGAVDLTDIRSITLAFESPMISSDLVLQEVSLAPIPLPATGLLLIAGLGGVAAMRRKAA